MGKIAEFLTGRLLAYSLIEESQQELYQYGLERLLSKLTSYSAFLVLALCIGKFIPTVLFLSFLFLLRGRTGGYHASTELCCFVSSMVTCILVMQVLVPYLMVHQAVLWVAFVVALLIILIWAPVNHPNVDFSKKELQQYRLRARRVLVIEVLLILLMLIGQVGAEYITSAMSGVIVCSVLISLAKITNKEV